MRYEVMQLYNFMEHKYIEHQDKYLCKLFIYMERVRANMKFGWKISSESSNYCNCVIEMTNYKLLFILMYIHIYF